MRQLMVCSLEQGAGKTALCVGLGRRFWKDGLHAGYVKTVSEGTPDPDAAFVRDILGLDEPARALAPLPPRSRSASPLQIIERAVKEMSSQHDPVLVETGHTLSDGALRGVSGAQVARALDARVLLVLRYRVDLMDPAVDAARLLGDCLAGAVVNSVPPSQLAKARESLRPALEAAGVPVFGTIPQDRVLLSVSVRDVAERLGSDVIAGHEGLEHLVERLMIGAMSVEGASVYFRKHPNKAVVTGGDRPDIHLAALDTPTRCLVLTGGFPVHPDVVARANARGVPVIVTAHDTLAAVEAINDLFHHSRFRQRAKVSRLESLVADHVDASRLLGTLGS